MVSPKTVGNTELKKLYELIEKIRVASLGADYQTRCEFNLIKEKAAQRIKELQSQPDNQSCL